MARISFPERRKNLAQQYAELPQWIFMINDEHKEQLYKTDNPKKQQLRSEQNDYKN